MVKKLTFLNIFILEKIYKTIIAIKTSSELHDLEIAISPILPPSPSQPNQTNITDETVIDMSGNPLADESRMEASETSFTQNPR